MFGVGLCLVSPVASLMSLLSTLFLDDSLKQDSVQDVHGDQEDHSVLTIVSDTNGIKTNSHVVELVIVSPSALHNP